MNLRNKKTGKVGYLIASKGIHKYTVTDNDWNSCGEYCSLAELSKEWEDYEESKEYYWVTYYGDIGSSFASHEREDNMKQIGNYFETREEAEKAVEKLKAWKRLKDVGFKFNGYKYMMAHGKKQRVYVDWFIPSDYEKYIPDLDLLFGGEYD